jgi:predicted cupin superfamily sugar epimerase
MYRTAKLTAADIKEILHLVPHFEGGYYRRTYESEEMLAPGALGARYSGLRHTGTAIYYLLEPGTFSEIHRLKSDEIFHFYLGDAVEMLQLSPPRRNVSGSAEPEDDPGMAERIILGNDLAQGQTPQVLAPKGVWQGSRLLAGGSFALLGCTVSPGFEREDYEAADRYTLTRQWPEFTALIRELTR